MSSFEEKQAARKQRLLDRAEKARIESNARYEASRSEADMIPFGQPILVGHHSEKSDRKRRSRIFDNMGKSVQLAEKAQYLERRAERVGTGGISSDDPNAIKKLQEKVTALKANHEIMKKVNAALRKTKNKSEEEQILAVMAVSDRFTREQVEKLRVPDVFGGIGFAGFTLTNSNAEIKRLEKRIKSLEATKALPEIEEEYENYIYRQDPKENRVMFIFEGKPDAEIRNILKSHAFKWSPSRGAWVRHLNNAGIYAADTVKKLLM